MLVSDLTKQALASPLPRNFRVVLPAKRGAQSIAGCGAFTSLQLASALSALSAPVVVVVDARRESHAHLAGRPVSWFSAPHNDEHRRARRTAAAAAALTGRRVAALGPAAATERALVASAGARYAALPIDDHRAPKRATVDAFVRLHDECERDFGGSCVRLYHCRAGRGRTTMLLVMHELLLLGRSGGAPRLPALVAKHCAAGGRDLFSVGGCAPQRARWAAKRAAFLEGFADFAAARTPGDPASNWSAYLESVR